MKTRLKVFGTHFEREGFFVTFGRYNTSFFFFFKSKKHTHTNKQLKTVVFYLTNRNHSRWCQRFCYFFPFTQKVFVCVGWGEHEFPLPPPNSYKHDSRSRKEEKDEEAGPPVVSGTVGDRSRKW